ncbi:unnamed protein product, partial [Prorocentrum cordatum]
GAAQGFRTRQARDRAHRARQGKPEEQRRRHGEGRLRQAGTHRPGRGPEQGLHHHAPHPEEQAVLPHRPQVAARQSHQGGGPRGRWLRPVRAPHDRVVAGGLRRHAEARLEGREEAPGDPQAGQEEARRDGGGAGGAAQEGRVSRGRAAGAAGRMGSSRLRCPEKKQCQEEGSRYAQEGNTHTHTT